MRTRFALLGAVFVATAILAGYGLASPAEKVDFPGKGKMITLIVSYAPGSASDNTARLLAAALEKELGVRVQVVNKPGASTQVGTTELARSKPDGYTLGSITFATTLTTYLDPNRKAAYSRSSFAPIAMYFAEVVVVAVKADSPFQTMKHVIDAAKASPDKVKAGDGGLMAVTHLASLAVQKATGTRFASVHFEGGGAGTIALLGGHLDIGVFGSGNLTSQFKAGQVRVLAILDKQETTFLPGVKTLEAQGDTVYSPASYGIAAPAGTPKEVVEILSRATKSALDKKDLQEKFENIGVVPRYADSETFAAFWADQEKEVKVLMDMAMQQK